MSALGQKRTSLSVTGKAFRHILTKQPEARGELAEWKPAERSSDRARATRHISTLGHKQTWRHVFFDVSFTLKSGHSSARSVPIFTNGASSTGRRHHVSKSPMRDATPR